MSVPAGARADARRDRRWPVSSRPAAARSRRRVAAARSLAPGILVDAPVADGRAGRGAAGASAGGRRGLRRDRRAAAAPRAHRRSRASARAAWPSGSASRCTSSGKMVPMRARYGRTPSPLDGMTGAVNEHFGLEGADRALVEQTLINRWEVAEGRRRGAHVGRGDRRVATAHAPRDAPPPSGRRASDSSSTRPEIRAVVVRRILEQHLAGSARSCSGSTTSTTRRRTRSRCSRASTAKRRKLRLLVIATARSETLETDLDAALRMEALRAEWNGKVIELKPLGDRGHRGAPPGDVAAPRRRGRPGDRAEPREPALRAPAPARVGRRRLPEARGRAYRVPDDALEGRAITTAELWDERLRAVSDELRWRRTPRRRSARTSAARS